MKFTRALLSAAFLFSAACKTVDNASEAKSEETPSGSNSGLLAPEQREQYARYLKDTLASFELMRGKTGLVKDSVWICYDEDLKRPNFMDTEQLTSPTNIGLDLILLSERLIYGTEDKAPVKATLAKLLQTLATIDYNHETGLFFRTYWPDTGKVLDIHLSSVDNVHLAYGLWTVGAAFRDSEPELAATARRLFDRMDFSAFYNEKTGLIGGNLRPADEDNAKFTRGNPQGKYVRDAFDYKYFGSEARSLYALGFALQIYKKAARDDRDFDQKILGPAIAGTIAEVTSHDTRGGALKLMRTWDGGGFQALLPGVLVREELYSPVLGELHANYAKRLLDDAGAKGVPSAHSASAFGVRGLRIFRTGDASFDQGLPIYNGAAGHVDMVATIHEDVNLPDMRRYWDIAYTPHPAFMAASFAREPALARGFADVFKSNESLSSVSPCVCGQKKGFVEPISPAPSCRCQSKSDLPNMPKGPDGIVGEPNLCTVSQGREKPAATDHLYQPGLGWMDGYYVGGPLKGRVVPIMISLDQGMVALSLFSILSPDGHHVGSKSLAADPQVSARLRQAYDVIDEKFKALR